MFVTAEWTKAEVADLLSKVIFTVNDDGKVYTFQLKNGAGDIDMKNSSTKSIDNTKFINEFLTALKLEKDVSLVGIL